MSNKQRKGLLGSVSKRLAKWQLARARDVQEDAEPVEAFRHYAALAQKGVAEAQYEVGQYYLRGHGVPPSLVEGARWLYQAAHAGLPEAAFSLGTLYAMGLPEGFDPTQLQSLTDKRADTENSHRPDFDKALHWARKGAEKGHGGAQALLAHLLTHGPETMRDLPKARIWYERAAENDAPQGHLGLGLVLLGEARSDAQRQRAAEALIKAAQAGVGTASATLGWMHETGVGVQRNLEEAARRYQEAAEHGIPSAQARYGMMLLRGVGIEANPLMAESWLRQAAYGGESDAAALLGDLYVKGEPPFKKSETALKWYRAAAEQGHVPAARALALLYLTGTGTRPDQRQAAHWLQVAAVGGDHEADVDLGNLFLTTRVPATKEESAQLLARFQKRAESGDPVGAFNLGVCLAQGIGGERNPTEALRWLEQAREGVVNAQYWYGHLLFKGEEMMAVPEEGFRWMEKAAQAGLPEACVRVGQILVSGQGGISQDHERALKYYQQAAEQGNAEALFSLGAMYGGGHDVPEDRDVARRYFRQAAELGHPLAQLMMGRYCLKGLGGPQETDQARAWLEKAAAQGVREAAHTLEAFNLPSGKTDISENLQSDISSLENHQDR